MASQKTKIAVTPTLSAQMASSVKELLQHPDMLEMVAERPVKERVNFRNLLREALELGYVAGAKDTGQVMILLSREAMSL